jgi:aspartyl-tRNA synthetase
MQSRRTRILFLALGLAVAGLFPAEAHSPHWYGPGWYIVTAGHGGFVIEDGQFPDGRSCNSELAQRRAAARHNEYDVDTCVKLAQDVDETSRAPSAPSMAPPAQTPPAPIASAPPTPLAPPPIPRFASLKREGIPVYQGPSTREPVRWIYMREGWPVKIIAGQGDWLCIRDFDGQTGWLEAKFLDSARTGILTGPRAHAIRARPERDSLPLAWAEPDVLLKLRRCDAVWCEVEGPHVDGFVERTALWGLLTDEIID